MTDPATNLIAAWADALTAADRSRHTIRAYTRTLHDFAAWYAEERRIPLLAVDLTPIDGKAYRDDLQQLEEALLKFEGRSKFEEHRIRSRRNANLMKTQPKSKRQKRPQRSLDERQLDLF